jgi:hypothetical protein
MELHNSWKWVVLTKLQLNCNELCRIYGELQLCNLSINTQVYKYNELQRPIAKHPFSHNVYQVFKIFTLFIYLVIFKPNVLQHYFQIGVSSMILLVIYHFFFANNNVIVEKKFMNFVGVRWMLIKVIFQIFHIGLLPRIPNIN